MICCYCFSCSFPIYFSSSLSLLFSYSDIRVVFNLTPFSCVKVISLTFYSCFDISFFLFFISFLSLVCLSCPSLRSCYFPIPPDVTFNLIRLLIFFYLLFDVCYVTVLVSFPISSLSSVTSDSPIPPSVIFNPVNFLVFLQYPAVLFWL